MRIFIFRDFKDFFDDLGGFGDLVPVLVSPTGIDTFFCDRKMDRSRSSGGVGWSPAACYVGGHVLQVGCATSGSIWRAPENVNPEDTFFCTLFPVFVSSSLGKLLSGSSENWLPDPRH